MEIETGLPSASPRSPRLKTLVAAVLILLLAAFLRFHNLDAQSFWNDEGNSARLSERSLRLILEGTASDIHPPLYYVLLRGWRELVGESEFGLRSLSAFAGLGVAAGTWALGKTGFQRRGAETQRKQGVVLTAVLLAALITAVSPPLIYYSQEARMYALLALEATLSTLFLFWWWAEVRQKAEGRRQKRVWLLAGGYVFWAAAGLYTQYAFPAVILAHNGMLFLLLIKDSRTRPEPVEALKRGSHSSIFNLRNYSGSRSLSMSKAKAGRSHRSGFDMLSRRYSEILATTYTVTNLHSLIFPVLAWFAMMLAVFLLYLPWLPIFLGNIGGGPGERPFLPDFLRDVFRWLAFGHTLEAEAAAAPLTAVFILMGLGVVLDRGWRTAVWLTALLIPILAAYIVGAAEPQLFKLLLVVIAPFAIVTVLVVFISNQKPGGASALSADSALIFGKWRLQYLGLLTILYVAVALGMVQSLVNLYTNPAYARADYRAMAAQIAADNHPNAGVILNAPNQWEVFTYYHRDGAPVYPLPLAGMSREQIQGELADIAARHERLYVIFWGDSQQDPERIVERWLDENSFKATERWEQDVRFVVYAVPSALTDEMETAVSQPFGDHISLRGYTLANSELAPGDILQIALFWQTTAPLAQRYKVFLHLLAENGQLVAQRDSEPGGALKPTTIWQPGETINDNHGLLIPPDLPPGSYTLILGLYDIADPNARLPIPTQTGVLDALPLETITIPE